MKIVNDRKKLLDYIRKYDIDKCFTNDMSSYMSLCTYTNNEDILISGDEMHHFYFIVEGTAKIFCLCENGKSVLLRFAKPLSELGSVEISLNNKILHANVQSLRNTSAIRISFKDLEEYAKDDIVFYKYLVKRLGTKLTHTSNAASLNISYPFKNRFASYLISVSGYLVNDRVDEITMTKLTELATFLGTSYRHLNRVIKELEDDKIIKKKKSSFVILDFNKLEELSGGFYE